VTDADHTATESDGHILVDDTTSAAVTITVPAALLATVGYELIVESADTANDVIVKGVTGSVTVAGQAVTQWHIPNKGFAHFRSDGTNLVLLARSAMSGRKACAALSLTIKPGYDLIACDYSGAITLTHSQSGFMGPVRVCDEGGNAGGGTITVAAGGASNIRGTATISAAYGQLEYYGNGTDLFVG